MVKLKIKYMDTEEIFKKIAKNLEEGEDEKVSELVKEAINSGAFAKEILDNALILGMNTISEKFKKREIFLPDVLLAAKAMYAGMEVIKPFIIKDKIPSLGKIVIGTVYGDLHDIGKNLVSIMLRGAGFDVIDLGNNVPAEKFIETAINYKASIIGLSALLTTTMQNMSKVIQILKEKKLYGNIKVIIGGAAVNNKFAKEIGADAYGYDAFNAVEIVKRILNLRS